MTTDKLLESRLTFVAYGITLAAFYAASFFPGERLWGFNYYGFFSWYGPLVLLLLGLLAVIPALRVARQSAVAQAERTGLSYAVMAAGLILVSLLGYVALYGRTHFLGDGLQLVSWLEEGKHFKPWEKGAYAVQRTVFGLLGGEGKVAAAIALRLVSWGSGLLFLTITAVGSYWLLDNHRSRLMLLAGMATGGYTLLFFGYFESYPLFAVSVVLFSMVGLAVAKDRIHRLWLLPPLLLAGWFHIFAVGLLPAAFYLLLRKTALSRAFERISATYKFAVTMAVGGLGVVLFAYLYQTNYFIRFTIVPIVNDRFAVQGYSMFSAKHVLDWLNFLWLSCPGLLVLITLWRFGGTVSRPRPKSIYLALLAIPPLAMTFLLNPGLGMPRDWDLFSFAGIPLNLLAFFYVLDGKDGSGTRRMAAALAVALGLIALVPRAAIQAMPEKAIALFDVYADLDVIRSRNGRYWELEYLEEVGDTASYRLHAFANRVALPHERWVQEGCAMARVGRDDEAMVQFQRTVRFAPCYPYAWSNLGTIYERRGQLDSALTCYRIACALLPFNAEVYNNTALVYSALGQVDQAEEYWLKAIEADPRAYLSILNLTQLYDKQQRKVERDSLLAGLRRTDDLPGDVLMGLSRVALDREHWDEARYWIERSVEAGLDTAAVRQLEAKHPQLISPP